MDKAAELAKKWEDFVNSFIFANYKTLEVWYAKREVAENDILFNYIKFPKAENGKQLTGAFVDRMINEFEADEQLCKLIFGPAYQKGTANVINDDDYIMIVWNKLPVSDLLEIDLDDPRDRKYLIDMFKWDVFNLTGEKPKVKITPVEKARRKKIDKILRALAIELKDPKIAPEGRDKENLEDVYTNYDWEKMPYWDKIDTPAFQRKFVQRKFNPATSRFNLYNPIELEWVFYKSR